MSATPPIPLSVMIPTLNEEANIRACIESLPQVSEIVVVDSHSVDATCEIAIELGARVVSFSWNGRLPKKKNWALANIPWKNDWVFILDADERFTPELSLEIEAILRSQDPTARGYYVNRRFYFMGGWLRHCGYYPSWNLRLFKHTAGRYEKLPDLGKTGSGDNEVHEHVRLKGVARHLRGELEHHAFPSISTWVEKHNRYSNWEARLILSGAAAHSALRSELTPTLARKRRLKHLARFLPFRPTLRFCYHYILRRGFLDGYPGYVFCRLMGMYEFLSLVKAAEINRGGRSRQ